MEDWLNTAAGDLGVDPIDDDTQERLLGVARDVAHGVERKLTPIATYMLGEAVQRRVSAGGPRERVLVGARGPGTSDRRRPRRLSEAPGASAPRDRMTFPRPGRRER